MRRWGFASLCAFAVVSLPAAIGYSADWPNFLGPDYNGISRETGIRKEWDKPIPLVWERNVGSAFSSFACVGDKVYTCGTQDKQQILFCLNADDGKVLWQNAFELEYRESQGGDGTRATPTVADGRVYILGARGLLLCLDAATGREVWRRQFEHIPQWGYSGSVLVEGDMAVASAGKEQGALVAFHKSTGSPIWKCGDDPAGYATPYPFTLDGRRLILGFTGTTAIIVDMASGRLLWRMPWKTDYDVNAAAPVFRDGYLFLSSGYDTGCALLKLRWDGDSIAADTVWRNEKMFLNKFQSCILHEGKLYGSDQKSLLCADFLTGREHWKKPRIKNGTLVLNEGYLMLLTEAGQLQIGRATPDDWAPVTTADILSDRCWTVPVLHHGRLYARSLERVVCFDMRSK